ncbi:MAG TPA: NTP transferase domain-containing protein, partial [Anaeromyxobacteraceae bacterium]|nr:NTP transferase domain-containing protein [Anaeromyxobacteraceae bacterium]
MGTARAPLAAIVLAAGKGTRMKSQKPKVLHEVCGRPLAFFPTRCALELGADPVVAVVGHHAEAVEAALGAALAGGALRFAVQREQLGTAHAVLAAREALGSYRGPVAILSGDTPLLTTETLRAVVEARAASGAAVSFAVMTLAQPRGYGRVVRDGRGAPRAIVEEKDASEA